MKNDLIERYLYAVTKRMNPKIREDVKQELSSLIDDMLLERCGDVMPTDKDIRVVLTELGSPQELYARYDDDSDKCLIGQPYYSTYKLVVKMVLVCMCVGLTIASLILQIMEPQDWLVAMGDYLERLWSSSFGMFAFVTIMFAVFHRKGIKLDEKFSLDDLPQVPKKKQEVSSWECVAGIGFCVVFLIVFLVVPRVFSAVITETWTRIPVFDTGVIRSRWYILVLFALAGIVRETVKLLEKQYNKRVLLTTVVVNILSAVLCIWWLGSHNVLNPDFIANMAMLFEGDTFLIEIFANFDMWFLGVILIALVMDTADALLKTLKVKV